MDYTADLPDSALWRFERKEELCARADDARERHAAATLDAIQCDPLALCGVLVAHATSEDWDLLTEYLRRLAYGDPDALPGLQAKTRETLDALILQEADSRWNAIQRQCGSRFNHQVD